MKCEVARHVIVGSIALEHCRPCCDSSVEAIHCSRVEFNGPLALGPVPSNHWHWQEYQPR
jgi:hypothetical protein